jgi:hypothetical protein
MIRLLGFPRCGTSWVRYIITFLTGYKPWLANGNSDLHDFLSEYIDDQDEKKFIKYHYVTDITYYDYWAGKPDQENDHFILILRNPIENVLSYYYSNFINLSIEKGKLSPGNLSDRYKMVHHLNEEDFINYALKNSECVFEIYNDMKSYLHDVKYYEEWSGKKIIVNYENLIDDPTSEIKRISTFLNCDEQKYEDMKNNITFHSENILNFKLGHKMKVNTKGKDLKFWRNKLSDKSKERMEEIINRCDIELETDLNFF